MGFGILFLGYSISAIFSMLGSYSFIGLLVGYFIMFSALLELRRYAPTFLYAIIASVAMLICSFYETAIGIEVLTGWEIILTSETIATIMRVIESVIECIFNFALLYGIADLSRRVDFSETKSAAYRNMVFVGISTICQFIPTNILGENASFVITLLMIPVLVCTALNLVLIFKCYAFICPEGEESMERKPSRFAFVNKWREKNDAKEQETIDYYNKKIENIRNKKRKKKK